MIDKRRFAALVVLALWVGLTSVTVTTANAWEEASLMEGVVFDENQTLHVEEHTIPQPITQETLKDLQKIERESAANAKSLTVAASRLLNAKDQFYRELGAWSLLTLLGAALWATPKYQMK